MRVMVLIKANAETEAGVMPSEQLLGLVRSYVDDVRTPKPDRGSSRSWSTVGRVRSASVVPTAPRIRSPPPRTPPSTARRDRAHERASQGSRRMRGRRVPWDASRPGRGAPC